MFKHGKYNIRNKFVIWNNLLKIGVREKLTENEMWKFDDITRLIAKPIKITETVCLY